MKDFFRSKFFTVIVILMLIAVIVPTVFGSMGLGGTLKNGINTMLTPVQKLFSYVSDAFEGFVSYFTEFDRISAENAELRSRISELQDKVSAAEETEQMNRWLFDYLELKREHRDYKLLDAAVTGHESDNYITVYLLDKGTAQGVEKDMPVITADGIVGHVADAGTDWAKVTTLLYSGSAVGAYAERSGVAGVVEGNYTLAKEGLCKMSYISADADIVVGDRIVSSGYGSVYPRGLVIGYVEAVEKNDESRALDVTVRPAVNIDGDIKRMMIVTDYESYTE